MTLLFITQYILATLCAGSFGAWLKSGHAGFTLYFFLLLCIIK
jgi:hypothetical protein